VPRAGPTRIESSLKFRAAADLFRAAACLEEFGALHKEVKTTVLAIRIIRITGRREIHLWTERRWARALLRG
jgi:hypothetical protein